MQIYRFFSAMKNRLMLDLYEVNATNVINHSVNRNLASEMRFLKTHYDITQMLTEM